MKVTMNVIRKGKIISTKEIQVPSCPKHYGRTRNVPAPERRVCVLAGK